MFKISSMKFVPILAWLALLLALGCSGEGSVGAASGAGGGADDSCPCTGITYADGTPIDPSTMGCHDRVCGEGWVWYSCTIAGWRSDVRCFPTADGGVP